MPHFLLLFFLLLSPAESKICSYFGEAIETVKIENNFAAEDEAEKVIKAIIDVVGLKPNFSIRAADVPNAAAVIIRDKRYILYNPDFIQTIDRRTNNRWASVSIMAHEIGHHLNGHTLTGTGSRPATELEADEFSGFALQKLGATLKDAQVAMSVAASIKTSHTHPARADRLKAIETGWNKSFSQMSGGQTAELKKILTPKPQQPAEIKKQSVLDSKFINYKVSLSADPTGKYYVTIKNHFVKIQNNELVVIADMIPTKSNTFPLILFRNKEEYLLINKSGVIVTPKGKKVGLLRKFTQA